MITLHFNPWQNTSDPHSVDLIPSHSSVSSLQFPQQGLADSYDVQQCKYNEPTSTTLQHTVIIL